MGTILSILIPALLLVYCLGIRSDWENIKGKRILIGALVGGILLYYAGLAFSFIDPVFASLFKLSGACVFFTGVALHSVKRPKSQRPDQVNEGNK